MKNQPHGKSANVRSAGTRRGAVPRSEGARMRRPPVETGARQQRRRATNAHEPLGFGAVTGPVFVGGESAYGGGSELLGEAVRRAIVAALHVWLRLGADA